MVVIEHYLDQDHNLLGRLDLFGLQKVGQVQIVVDLGKAGDNPVVEDNLVVVDNSGEGQNLDKELRLEVTHMMPVENAGVQQVVGKGYFVVVQSLVEEKHNSVEDNYYVKWSTEVDQRYLEHSQGILVVDLEDTDPVVDKPHLEADIGWGIVLVGNYVVDMAVEDQPAFEDQVVVCNLVAVEDVGDGYNCLNVADPELGVAQEAEEEDCLHSVKHLQYWLNKPDSYEVIVDTGDTLETFLYFDNPVLFVLRCHFHLKVFVFEKCLVQVYRLLVVVRKKQTFYISGLMFW